MFEPEDIYLATRALLPYLSKILGEERSMPLESDIEGLLVRADQGEKVDNQLLDLLTQEDDLREWLKTALLVDTTRGERKVRTYETPPGDVGPVSTLRFVCPQKGCGFTWHLRRVGQSVPLCPVHKSALVLAPQGE